MAEEHRKMAETQNNLPISARRVAENQLAIAEMQRRLAEQRHKEAMEARE